MKAICQDVFRPLDGSLGAGGGLPELWQAGQPGEGAWGEVQRTAPLRGGAAGWRQRVCAGTGHRGRRGWWGGLDLGGGFGLRGEEQDYYWQVRLGLQRTKATVN